MTLIKACEKVNENKVHANLFPDVEVQRTSTNKFTVGDLIRINKRKVFLIKFSYQIIQLKYFT